jgi:hypothetical protein
MKIGTSRRAQAAARDSSHLNDFCETEKDGGLIRPGPADSTLAAH